MPEQDNYAPQVHKAQEVIYPTLVTDDQTSEAPEPGEQALHLPAPLITPQLAPVLGLRFPTPPSVWGDHLDTLALKLRVERVRVVRPVPEQPLWLLVDEPRFQGLLDERDLVWRSTRYAYGEREDGAIRHRHELRSLATLGCPDRTAPFIVGTEYTN